LDIFISIWEFINIINEQNKWRNYLSCKLQNPFILLNYIIRKNLLCYLIQNSNARHIAKQLLSMKKITPNYWMLGSLWDSYELLQLSSFSNSFFEKLLQHSLFLESKLKKVESSMGPLFIAIVKCKNKNSTIWSSHGVVLHIWAHMLQIISFSRIVEKSPIENSHGLRANQYTKGKFIKP